MRLVLVALISFLSACSTMQGGSLKEVAVTPPAPSDAVSNLLVEKEIQPLTRAEVIAGIGECEAAKLRPVLLLTKRKVNGQIIPAVVEVTCQPQPLK